MWTHPWRRHRCARIIVTLLVFFLLEVLPVRARERVAIANVEEGENETKMIKKKKISGGCLRDV